MIELYSLVKSSRKKL